MRFGIDLGGTKTELLALAEDGTEALRRRVSTVQDYDAIVRNISQLVSAAEGTLGARATVGIGTPGCISPATGLMKGSNTTCVNGRPLHTDLAEALGRPVRVENDANCLALSEASDGAAAGLAVVFGVIVGTGCGGGVVVNGRVLKGRLGIAGEWGHNPLPWPTPEENPGPRCWCGKHNCMEVWVSGTGLARDADGPNARDARAVEQRALAGDADAAAALRRHADRLARGLATVVNLLDPDAIVLGGGLSRMPHLPAEVTALLPRYVFSDVTDTPVLPAKHGDSSGVRGAAWLWSAQEARQPA